MQDFTQALELKPLLQEWGIDSTQNFEDIFSDMHENGEQEKLEKIIEKINTYFEQLELPETPTLYDHLVLSLRGQDLITTFNWDPLLLQAYCRNGNKGIDLPRLAFLHGNIRTGFCEQDGVAGLCGRNCSKCNQPFKPSKLLYPIKQKNYTQDPFINQEWQQLHDGFQRAIMVTIFGYSAPKTDVEAITAMENAWGLVKQRNFEQIHFISRRSEEETIENWKQFIHTHHYTVYNNFYNSFIGHHPRQTQEAYFHQHLGAEFIDNTPIPQDLNFEELWKWFRQLKEN